MFFHNFKYVFKSIFKDKGLIFWTFAFPILLGTFFSMAFSDIEKNEMLDIINIGIVSNEEFNNNVIYKDTFKSLSDEANKERLFDINYSDEDTLKKELENMNIIGYLILEENVPKIIVQNSGTNETIFKFVVDEINQTQSMIGNVIEYNQLKGNQNIEELYSNIYSKIEKVKNDENIQNITSNNISYTMIEFYTLIAMTCLYGGMISMVAINNCLPNMSSKGKRISVTSTSKFKIIISSLLASYLIQLIGLFLLFIYTIFVLKIDYGSNLPLIILLSLIGSFAGLSLGVFVATIFKTNENGKTGILISITMLGCFLSGMMGITMKYIIDKNIPILNKINPANMITDGFYGLYYYDTLDRYIINIISLILFSLIMILISYKSLRRQKYDSI